MHYVGFSSATIVASLILFQGFDTTDATNTVSLLTGFIVTFLGVHILNLSRNKPIPALDEDGLEDPLINNRMSLQGRLSIDGWHGIVEGRGGTLDAIPRTPRSTGHGRRSSLYRAQSSTLFNAFDGDDDVRPSESMGLQQLKEEDETEEEDDAYDADERTRLRNGGLPQQNGVRPSTSRSHSRSPGLPPSLGDGRISGRPV